MTFMVMDEEVEFLVLSKYQAFLREPGNAEDLNEQVRQRLLAGYDTNMFSFWFEHHYGYPLGLYPSRSPNSIQGNEWCIEFENDAEMIAFRLML